MFMYAQTICHRELDSLQNEYARIIKASQFQTMYPENAEADIIDALTELTARIYSLQYGLTVLQDNQVLFDGHTSEVA